MVSSEGYRTVLEVDVEVTSLGHVIDAALRHGAVRDLTVEDAPLDAVIRALLRRRRCRGWVVKAGRRLAKYAAFARIAARQARRDRGELYGRVVFFAVMLGVFASLWRATREAGVVIAGDPRTLVWYLAGTEWVLLSAPMVHVDIQEAVRRGDVACLLGRPVSYVGAAFAEGLGQLSTRAPVLAATAFLCAFAFTGMDPAAAARWRGRRLRSDRVGTARRRCISASACWPSGSRTSRRCSGSGRSCCSCSAG